MAKKRKPLDPAEIRELNKLLFAKISAPAYLYSAPHVNSGFNKWFKQTYRRDPGAGKALDDAEHDERISQTYLSIFTFLWFQKGRTPTSLDKFLYKPVPSDPAIDAVNDFTRMKMRGDHFQRIVPAVPISNDELDKPAKRRRRKR